MLGFPFTVAFFSLILGSLFFLPIFAANAAEIPLAEQEAISEDCVAKTEEELRKKAILPSEESSEYDNAFDAVYIECMQSAGLTDAPIEDIEEDLSQQNILQ